MAQEATTKDKKKNNNVKEETAKENLKSNSKTPATDAKPEITREEWDKMSIDEKREFLQDRGATIHKEEVNKGKEYALQLWAKVDVMTRYTHTEFLKHYVSIANASGVPKAQRAAIKKQLMAKYGMTEYKGIIVQQELKHEPGAKVYQTQGIPELTQDYLDTLNEDNEVDEKAKEAFIKKYENQFIGYEKRLDGNGDRDGEPSDDGGAHDGDARSGEGADKEQDTGGKEEVSKGTSRSSGSGVRKGESSPSKVQKDEPAKGGNRRTTKAS